MQISNKSQKILTSLVLCLIFIVLLAVNFASNKFFGFVRLDLTHNRMFTLSEGSHKILANIDEPITLKLFFSKQLAKDNPYFLSFASRVEEFLKLYQRYSNNKINLQIIDPAPYTEQEDQAVHYGLQGVPVNNDGSELYFGLVAVNATTGKEIIPFLQPNREGYLEYDITQLVAKLTNSAANKVSIISSLPIQGEPGFQFMSNKSKPWVIWQQIKQQFDANILNDEQIEKIPEDTKVLLLINSSEELPLTTAKAIDEFVLRGGNVLLLLDSFSEIQQNNFSIKQDKDDSQGKLDNNKFPITKLLQAWGVDYDANKIVASRSLAKQVRYANEGKEMTGLYPLWLDVNPASFAKDDILTANLTKLTFATAGNISANPQSSSKFSPLVVINSDAMLINKDDVAKYKSNPISLLREYKAQEQPVTLAARITGGVKSAFSDKIAKQANIVIVANADFLHDHFWASTQNFLGNQIVIPNSGNGTFILNALDNLTGSDALISIRNKDAYTRGFDKIREIELQSQNKFQQTETALLKRIEETKKKLSTIDQQTLSVEHKREEEAFRKDLIETRKQLREVRRSLKEDIQILENKIKFFTIVFIPLLIVVLFITYWLMGNKFCKVFRYKRYDKKFN